MDCNSKTMSNVDINSGNIGGATIATSNITVGSGKILDVSAGTLTTSPTQKLAILEGASNDIDIGDYKLSHAGPTANDHSATKEYVDNRVIAPVSASIAVSSSGTVVLSSRAVGDFILITNATLSEFNLTSLTVGSGLTGGTDAILAIIVDITTPTVLRIK